MSSNSGTTDNVVVDIPERSADESANDGGGVSEQRPRIFRAPILIRESDQKAYEPIMVSLGPYHRPPHGRLKEMEECKRQYYLNMQLESNRELNEDDYIREMKELEERARSCYKEKFEMSSDDFAEMLLLDGSFVVQFLMTMQLEVIDSNDSTKREACLKKSDSQNTGTPWLNQKKYRDPTTETPWFPMYAYYDMILLENQLPFFVLQTLYNHSTASFETKPLFSSLVLSYFRRFSRTTIPETDHDPTKIHHLLHLFHSCITSSPPRAREHSKSHWDKLLECLCCRRSPCCGSTSDVPDLMRESIPNAVQLNEAGIMFKMGEQHSLPYVTFQNGVVEMAQLVLYDGTGTQMKNLIAFEQCHPESGAYISCYAKFMERLLLKPEDVTLLQKKGVLVNQMGSEGAAVGLLSHLCKNAIVSAERSYLRDFYLQVNQYHRSRCPRWRARLARDYFSNPWSILSFLAALFLILLSVTGTLFAILNYLRKRKQA